MVHDFQNKADARPMKPVWIVDDDRSIRWVLEKTLAARADRVQEFCLGHRSHRAAWIVVSSRRRCWCPTFACPASRGLNCCKRSRSAFPGLPVIIMTAYSDLESAVAAFQGGAFEYLPKPFDVDQALELIRRALDQSMHQVGASEEPSA
jgi:two-component system nitrogen regulation response regulator GlnG